MNRNLPLKPIRILVTPHAEHDYLATSPDYQHCGEESAPSAGEAVERLLWSIAWTQPLTDAVKTALRRAGHTADVIAEWERQAHPDMRHSPQRSVDFFAEYTDAGVPAHLAFDFHWKGFDGVTAGAIHAAGQTAADAKDYYREAEGGWDDDDLWRFDPLPWVVAGFPIERLHLYAHALETPTEASIWEAWVATNQVSDSDLSLLLQAKFDIAELAAATTSTGTAPAIASLIEAARTLLGLDNDRDPWA